MIWMLTSLAFAAPNFSVFDTQTWTDVGTKNSPVGKVVVRQTKIDGVTCLEGTAITDASVGSLTQLSNNMVSAKTWSSAGLTISTELERSGQSFVLFQYYDTPGWTLASDRYWVIRAQVSESAGVGRYRWERVPAETRPAAQQQAQAVSSGAIEPPVNYGEWQFSPASGGTQVRYRSCSDFGGSVPSSVQRWAATQQLPDLVADLITEAKRR